MAAAAAAAAPEAAAAAGPKLLAPEVMAGLARGRTEFVTDANCFHRDAEGNTVLHRLVTAPDCTEAEREAAIRAAIVDRGLSPFVANAAFVSPVEVAIERAQWGAVAALLEAGPLTFPPRLLERRLATAAAAYWSYNTPHDRMTVLLYTASRLCGINISATLLSERNSEGRPAPFASVDKFIAHLLEYKGVARASGGAELERSLVDRMFPLRILADLLVFVYLWGGERGTTEAMLALQGLTPDGADGGVGVSETSSAATATAGSTDGPGVPRFEHLAAVQQHLIRDLGTLWVFRVGSKLQMVASTHADDHRAAIVSLSHGVAQAVGALALGDWVTLYAGWKGHALYVAFHKTGETWHVTVCNRGQGRRLHPSNATDMSKVLPFPVAAATSAAVWAIDGVGRAYVAQVLAGVYAATRWVQADAQPVVYDLVPHEEHTAAPRARILVGDDIAPLAAETLVAIGTRALRPQLLDNCCVANHDATRAWCPLSDWLVGAEPQATATIFRKDRTSLGLDPARDAAAAFGARSVSTFAAPAARGAHSGGGGAAPSSVDIKDELARYYRRKFGTVSVPLSDDTMDMKDVFINLSLSKRTRHVALEDGSGAALSAGGVLAALGSAFSAAAAAAGGAAAAAAASAAVAPTATPTASTPHLVADEWKPHGLLALPALLSMRGLRVVTGDAGAGKTTLLQNWAWRWAVGEAAGTKDAALGRFELVVYLPLRRLLAFVPADLEYTAEEAITEWVASLYARSLPSVNHSEWRSMLFGEATRDDLLWLLDGFDEVADTIVRENAARDTLLSAYVDVSAAAAELYGLGGGVPQAVSRSEMLRVFRDATACPHVVAATRPSAADGPADRH